MFKKYQLREAGAQKYKRCLFGVCDFDSAAGRPFVSLLVQQLRWLFQNEALRSKLLWIQSERHLPSVLPSYHPPTAAANQSNRHARRRAAVLFACRLTYIFRYIFFQHACLHDEGQKQKKKKERKATTSSLRSWASELA